MPTDDTSRPLDVRRIRFPRTEILIWGSLFRWATRRSHRLDTTTFTYGRSFRTLLYAVMGLAILEGLVLDGVLGIIFGPAAWVGVIAGLHAYAVIWILGLIASFRTRPHALERDRIVVRDTVFREISIPFDALDSFHSIRESVETRTGYTVDESTQTVLLGYGTANIRLVFNHRISDVRTLKFSADDPDALLHALDAAMSESGHAD